MQKTHHRALATDRQPFYVHCSCRWFLGGLSALMLPRTGLTAHSALEVKAAPFCTVLGSCHCILKSPPLSDAVYQSTPHGAGLQLCSLYMSHHDLSFSAAQQVVSAAVPNAILTGPGTGGAGMALAMAATRMTAEAAADLMTGAGEAAAVALLTPTAPTGAGPGMAALGALRFSVHYVYFLLVLPIFFASGGPPNR